MIGGGGGSGVGGGGGVGGFDGSGGLFEHLNRDRPLN